MIRRPQLPLLLLVLASLLTGLWTGLSRLGWNLDLLSVSLHHGAIMVGGFLGTLLSLQRIIPLKRKSLLLIPLLSATSVIPFLAGRPLFSFALLTLAALGFTLVFVYRLLRERTLEHFLTLTGALCWFSGNLTLIVENFYPLAFPWWLAFALLIVSAERLELIRASPSSLLHKLLLLPALALCVAGAFTSFHGIGKLLCGAALIAVAIWLMRYDNVGLSLKKSGLPGYTATSLLVAYVSLLLTGVLFVSLGNQAMAYDATVHTFFMGFVFSVIFANGPVILSESLGIPTKAYHPVLYAWLILLHLSWITRISADILLSFHVRNLSGIASAAAILGYFTTLVMGTINNQQKHAKIL